MGYNSPLHGHPHEEVQCICCMNGERWRREKSKEMAWWWQARFQMRFRSEAQRPKRQHCHLLSLVYNGNGKQWSLVWSVITLVINKLGQQCCSSLICLIRSMIANWIGQREVLLPIIGYNHYNFWENKCIPFFVKELLIPNTIRVTV